MNHEISAPHTARRPAAPSGVERLRAALRWAERARTRPAPAAAPGTPAAPGAMLTGLTALSLRGFPGVPSPDLLERVEVLVGPGRRLRGTAEVAVRTARVLPGARPVAGLPCAPVPRAVADAVAYLADPAAVRALLTESARAGGCAPGAVVAELAAAGLLSRAEVAAAADALLARGRALAEDRLYALVREFGLPDPLWNVDLLVPGGPYLGPVDAFWPEHGVALELEARAPVPGGAADGELARRTQAHLARLGVEVVRTTPARLHRAAARQAAALRTALAGAEARGPARRLVVLPR